MDRHESSTQTSLQTTLRQRLGAAIVKAREERDWTQVDLARRLKVPRERLGKWERGLHSPGLEDLARLSEVLGVPLSELGIGEPAESLPARELMGLARQVLAMSRPLRPYLNRLLAKERRR